MVDLLGEEIDFTPYVEAPQHVEFGHFHEATPKQVTSPTSPYVIFVYLFYQKNQDSYIEFNNLLFGQHRLRLHHQ
jgi:hypothetical protein